MIVGLFVLMEPEKAHDHEGTGLRLEPHHNEPGHAGGAYGFNSHARETPEIRGLAYIVRQVIS
jgi:hypothetical protein